MEHIKTLLRLALENLRQELMDAMEPLKFQLKDANAHLSYSVFVNSEKDFGLLVEGPIEFKSYFPKIYARVPVIYNTPNAANLKGDLNITSTIGMNDNLTLN